MLADGITIRRTARRMLLPALAAAALMDRRLWCLDLLALAWWGSMQLPRLARPRLVAAATLVSATVAAFSLRGDLELEVLLAAIPALVLCRIPARVAEVLAASSAMVAALCVGAAGSIEFLIVVAVVSASLVMWWCFPHPTPPGLARQLAHDLRSDLSSAVWAAEVNPDLPTSQIVEPVHAALARVLLAESVLSGPPTRSAPAPFDPTPVLHPLIPEGLQVRFLVRCDRARFAYACAVLGVLLGPASLADDSSGSITWSSPKVSRVDGAALSHVRVMLGPGHLLERGDGAVELRVSPWRGVSRRTGPAPCIPWPAPTRSW